MSSEPDRGKRRWRWRSRLAIVGLGLTLGFVAVNLVARYHAHAFLHFDATGVRTAKPDELSRLAKLRVLFTGVSVPRPEDRRTPAAFGLDYSEVEFAGEDGVTLGAWFVPIANPVGTVVLFHGYASAKDSLLEAALGFRSLGYECYLVDFRGSGDSSAAYTTLGVREAADVAAVVRGLERSGPVVLYGVSMGAAAILRALAKQGVQADAVILDAPFDRMLTTVRNRFETMGVPAFPAAELLVFWGGQSFEFDGFEHNPAVDGLGVAAPTLIVHGADDPHARPIDVHAVFDALGGPKQIHEFAGVGHEQIAVVRPGEWLAITATFLRELPGDPGPSSLPFGRLGAWAGHRRARVIACGRWRLTGPSASPVCSA